MNIDEFERMIGMSDENGRINLWKTLSEKPAGFDFKHDDAQFLWTLLKGEQNIDVRTIGTICNLQYIEWKRSPTATTFRDRLFKPFLPRSVRPAGVESAVVSVYDGPIIRDSDALMLLRGFLHPGRFQATEFYKVSFPTPNWDNVPLDNLDAVCFVGRPSMFRNCQLVDAFPHDLRFVFPGKDEPLDEQFRGGNLTNESIESYHHIYQQRPTAGSVLYRAAERENQRTDYAVVQRFCVDHGGRQVTVLVLAGATSLGTYGAAEWITSHRLDDGAYLDVAEKGTDRIEALLEVTANVRVPPEPWRPKCVAKKMFSNGGPNLLAPAPQTITLGVDKDDSTIVRYILFDNDEVKLADNDHAALVALCLKCEREGNQIFISDLLQDPSVWPSGQCRFNSEDSAVKWYRDHTKRAWLRNQMSVETKPHAILRVFPKVEIKPL